MASFDTIPHSFGSLRLDRDGQAVLARGYPLPLHGHRLSLLRALIEADGHALNDGVLLGLMGVAKEDGLHLDGLLAEVTQVNRILARYTQGQCFVARHAQSAHCLILADGVEDVPCASPTVPLQSSGGTNFPGRISPLFGRDDPLRELTVAVSGNALVTLTGPGGIGKTALAVELSASIRESFADGACFVDFAPLNSGDYVASAVASRLKRAGFIGGRPRELLDFLEPLEFLLVLDNCEHVIDAVADLVRQILACAPDVRIVATSHENLRLPAEYVYRIGPIGLPEPQQGLLSRSALEFPSVQLFCERARERCGSFNLQDEDAAGVSAICRRLGGTPLAIELAAAHTDRFTVAELAAAMDKRMLAIDNASPRLPARHRSLQALHEWSYELLDLGERAILRCLAVFPGPFTLSAATAVAEKPGIPVGQIAYGLGGLVAKSLVAVDLSADPPCYRLLESTRAFIRTQLEGADEFEEISQRHAYFVKSMFHQAARDWATLTRAQWLEVYGVFLDDSRTAIQWAFASSRTASIGVDLTIATVALYYQLSLLHECRTLVERALAILSTIADSPPAVELQLTTALGGLIGQTGGPASAMELTYRRAMVLAESTGTDDLQAQALDGVWMGEFMAGNYPRALLIAEQCVLLARRSGETAAIHRTARMLAQAEHFSGNHARARLLSSELLAQPTEPVRALLDSSVSAQVSMRVVAARTLWMQGFSNRAFELALEAVEIGLKDVTSSAAQALAWAACPIALWSGRNEEARVLVDRLVEHAERHDLPFWRSWGRCFDAVLHERAPPGSPHDLPLVLAGEVSVPQCDTLGTLSATWITPANLARARHGLAGWSSAELLRAGGEVALQNFPCNDCEKKAERAFIDALQIARQQQALAWELRCATSLARLYARQAKNAAALDLLFSVRERFTEGFETTDLRAADTLLHALGGEIGRPWGRS